MIDVQNLLIFFVQILCGTVSETVQGKRQLTLDGHIITAEQWTIIQQYGDWYTGR